MTKTRRKRAAAPAPKGPQSGPFPYADYTEALAEFQAARDSGPFYGVLSGSSGMGKSSLLHDLAGTADAHRFQTVYLSSSRANVTNVVRFLAYSLRVAPCRSHLETVQTFANALRSQPGPVLFFGAEDSLPALRTRFEGIAAQRGIALSEVPIYLLDVAQLRLDRPDQLARLSATVAACAPRLLVLDPFVRLARVDENSAAEVSAVLGSLRELNRLHDLAILLVHHARKSSGSSPTQAFRGSGDFGAWGDSNLHVTKRSGELRLAFEHRSAAPPEPLRLRLALEPAPHLALLSDGAPPPVAHDDLQRTLLERLLASPRPHSTTELREAVRRRKADVVAALGELQVAGHVERSSRGWARVAPEPPPAADHDEPAGQCSLFHA